MTKFEVVTTTIYEETRRLSKFRSYEEFEKGMMNDLRSGALPAAFVADMMREVSEEEAALLRAEAQATAVAMRSLYLNCAGQRLRAWHNSN